MQSSILESTVLLDNISAYSLKFIVLSILQVICNRCQLFHIGFPWESFVFIKEYVNCALSNVPKMVLIFRKIFQLLRGRYRFGKGVEFNCVQTVNVIKELLNVFCCDDRRELG